MAAGPGMMADSQEALRRSGAGCREPAVSRDLQSSRVHARVRGSNPPSPPAPAQFPRHWLDSWAWTELEPLRSCGNGKHLALTPPWAILKALQSFRHQRGWWNEFYLINSQNIFMNKPKMRVKRIDLGDNWMVSIIFKRKKMKILRLWCHPLQRRQ